MSTGTAWRYPAFFSSPYTSEYEFTFSPPHTLFIDASMQLQDASEAISVMLSNPHNSKCCKPLNDASGKISVRLRANGWLPATKR